VVLYFLAAFLIYSASDLVAWRVSFYHAIADWVRHQELLSEKERELEHMYADTYRSYLWSRATRPMALIRAVFEFAVPVIIGVYAVLVLASAPPPKNEVKGSPAKPTSTSSGPSQPTTPLLPQSGAGEPR
jgi:hypothetical protein